LTSPVIPPETLQQAAMPMIGFLNNSSPATYSHLLDAFRQGLQDSGFSEEENVVESLRKSKIKLILTRHEQAPRSWRRHRHLTAYQIGCEVGQSVVVLRPAILDRHILALDVAGFTNALAECGQKTCTIGRRSRAALGTQRPVSPAAAPMRKAATRLPRRRAA
jgi:hypothetical protein